VKGKLVIVKITDGLGNQLFQYAFARKLSIELGADLLIDRSVYRRFFLFRRGTRRYQLNRFPIKARASTGPAHRLFQILGRKQSLDLREKNFYHLDTEVLEAIAREGDKRLILVSGYWQSYRYFDEYREIICRELRPHFECTIGSVSGRDNVAIHVRRGDYHDTIFRLCSIEYYRAALELVIQTVRAPRFIIFSNDLEWTRDYFGPALEDLLGDYQIADNHDDIGNFLDMVYGCKHYIIANSTYSWWSAYLCTNPEKIVIAPEEWFENPEWNAELYPEGWIRVRVPKESTAIDRERATTGRKRS